MNEKRLAALRRHMAQLNVDAFLVSNAENRRYLSGFAGSSGELIITPEAAFIVTDFRYFEQVQDEAPAFTLHKQTELLSDAVGELLHELRPARLGFEADAMTVAGYKHRRQAAPQSLQWVATEGLLLSMRARKDEEEIALLRKAQTITDRAFARFLRHLRPGRSERELAWELEVMLHELGAEGPSFDTIVAIGENAALPHYRPYGRGRGERIAQEGDLVLVDFGARVAGYHADMTRTVFLDEPDETFRRVYETCLGALEVALQTIRPGVNARRAHEAVHDYLRDHGYGENFGHGLGHGVGLAIHEQPAISWRAPEETEIPVNSVVTLEPGIYIPGRGGVRIEDLVVVREDGIENLTHATKAIDAWRHRTDS